MKNYSVVLPASGVGQRFENEQPKQFVLIRNLPLIYYTIKSFVNCSHRLQNYVLNEIVISCEEQFEDYMREKVIKLLIKQDSSLKIKLVKGGQYRHQSIFNCLKHLEETYKSAVENLEHIVLIHDAVRPLVDPTLVEKLLKNAMAYGASGPICNLSSTVLKTNEDDFLEYALNREEFKASEMPQSFRFDCILTAYKSASETDMKFGTECLDLVRRYARESRIKLIPSNANKLFKVTYRKDYFSALGLIRKKLTYRCLAFTDNPKEKINLNKFNSNLNLISSNELDVNSIEFESVDDLDTERSDCSKIDVLFLFSKFPLIKNLEDFISFNSNYNDMIAIFQLSTEKDKYDLMNKYDDTFMKSKRLTILYSQDNPMDNIILFERIKLICNNFNLMIGQYIKI